MTKRIVFVMVVAALSLFAFSALAGVTLSNEDSQSYKILIAPDDTCFSGLHTSIGSNTTTSVDAGWLCIDEKKPGFKMEDGKSYKIKNGKVEPK